MFSKLIFTVLPGLFLSVLTTTTPIFSQAPSTKKASAFEFIAQKEGAAFELEFDLTEMLNNRKKTDYFPAGIKLENGTTLELEVRARGKFRRRICEVPPLKMKLAKKDMRALGLDTLNEVRLVLPCTFTPEDEARLLREYIAYRMYERLSDYHVKARLVHLTIRDSHTENTKPTIWAILLEHDEEIAVRLDGAVEKNFGVQVDSLNTEQAALNAVFQYMIGNTDWSIEDARNMYQLRPKTGGKIIPIPFDFDFSGLVNAPYATPTKESGLANVRERALLLNGLSNTDIQKAMETIKSAEADLLKICQVSQLHPNEVKEVEQYITDFFTAVKTPGKMPTKIKSAK